MTDPNRPFRARMITKFAAAIVAMTTIAAGAATGALAADPQVVGVFGDWTAYSFSEKAGKVCYMASQPKKAEGDYTSRGDIFTLITHRPGEDSLNVVSVVAGYPYKDGGEVQVLVDSESFGLFTHGDRAWARDSKTDAAIANAVRKGSKLVVKGTSQRGTLTTDTYSLRGSANAYEAISKACGVEVK